MTDDNDNTADETEEQNEQQAEPMTFQVNVSRVYEVDFAPQQVEQMMARSDATTEIEIIEQMAANREAKHVEPQEKLVGIDATAKEV